MKLTKILTTLLLPLHIALAVTGCERTETKGTNSAASSQDGKARQVATAPWTHTAPKENITVSEIEENSAMEIITETPDQKQAEEIREKTLALVESRDFTALDSVGADFLKSKERDAEGGWKLGDFYDSFELRDNLPTPLWERRRGFLEEWIAAKPESQTARIALAQFYIDYAWRARGSGYADTVTEEGWRLMGERLEKSGNSLGEAAEKLTITDPMFFQTGLKVLLGAGGSPDSFDGLVAGSLEIAPDYWGSLSARAYSLLPRWHGETGDWEAFAKFIAEENDPYGKEQYAFIVLQRHAFDSSSVDPRRLDWDLFKKSVRELFEKYPEAVTNISRAAFIATVADDRDFAKECFALLGDRCVPAVWKVNGRMCHYRNWANTGKW